MSTEEWITGIDIAPLDAEAVGGVILLYRDSIQPVWQEHGRDHDLNRIEDNVRQRLGSQDYWMTVARRRWDVVGYSAWEKHLDHTSRHVVAHLRMLLVRRDLQGSGLGKALMARFESAARGEGCTKVLFDVVVGSPAYDFYLSQGYRHWSHYMEKLIEND